MKLKIKKLKINKKTEEWDKHVHKKFDIDERESIISADNIKEECFVEPNNGRYQANKFCNILSRLLQDDTVDATKSDISCDESEKLIHSDKINLSSDVRDKKSSSNNNGKKHNLTRTDKHFTCNICEKRFKHSSNLKRHQVTHTGDKPFK